MSFTAQNDRILIADSLGNPVFDTNNKMPKILGTLTQSISNDFVNQYNNDKWISLIHLPYIADFIICQATISLTGKGSYSTQATTYNGTIVMPFQGLKNGDVSFFQGTLMLESGADTVNRTPCIRTLNVWQDPNSNNTLMAKFEQLGDSLQSTMWTTWGVDLQVWYGKF